MTFKDVLEFKYITISEAKEILEKLVEKRKESGELIFETRKTMNYLNTISKLSGEDSRKLVDEIKSLPYVTEEIAIKIADLLPDLPDEVRVIFAKERITINPEQIQAILDIVKKYKN